MFGLNAIDSYEVSASMFWEKASTCDKVSPTLTQVHIAEIRFSGFIVLFLEGPVSMNLKNLGKIWLP